MSEWPEGWVSGAEKIAEQKEYRMTNDHGILYLCGEVRDGEWLHTMDTLPPKYQNNR